MAKKNLKKCKYLTLLIIFFVFLLMCFTAMTLQNYLYQIQVEERLSRIEDYEDFTVSVEHQKREYRKHVFNYDGYSYYFDGLEQVYISYGTTKITLEKAITEEYIAIKNILEWCVEIEEDNSTLYVHDNKDESKTYKVRVEGDNITFLR